MKIGIVGLGLIGGSLGLDLREKGFKVFGVSRKEKTCQRALERGLVDDSSTSLTLLSATEIVFICTPIGAITPTVKQLIPHISPETILTDVGSVKGKIVEEISPLWPNFVGGHPMAGTAEQGIEVAQKDLFSGAAYVLTPTETTPEIAVKKVEEIARSLDSNIYFCTPQEHDRAVAWISHLPVMVSASLIDACMDETNSNVLTIAQQLASSGFRDTSRVGGGNPELGVMMARYNQSFLLRSLSQYCQTLDQLIEQIEQENWDKLEQILNSTQQARPKFIE
ncbi:MAG: prephenate/arogenate dehydrogenase [Moorea sp. SIO2B7]|nr:prephenate/arogenate dehydrogenase [Moorena sp. SIO2B7]